MLCCCVFNVRGEIVGCVGKRSTANAFAKDVSLIQNEGQVIEDMKRHRLNYTPCRLDIFRSTFGGHFVLPQRIAPLTHQDTL